MTRPSYFRFAILVAAGTLLAGCGLAQSIVPSTGPGNVAAKGLKQRDLLYVSNANGTVSVYTYWQRRLVSVLTGFKDPLGECADSTGDVYIVDYQRRKIDEYAHGGKQPIKVIDDSPYTPYACSVSLENGNLAVANYVPYKSGNIAIYPRGSGKRVILTGSRFGSDFAGCAYDDHGDLLAMSAYLYSAFFYYDFYYLPKDGIKLIPMKLPGISGSSQSDAINIQGVAWDGKYWVVGPIYNVLYLYTINVKAYNAGMIQLKSQYGYAGPIGIYRKSSNARGTQVVAETNVYRGNGDVEYWEYPAGGTSIAKITKDLASPFGIAISLGSQ